MTTLREAVEALAAVPAGDKIKLRCPVFLLACFSGRSYDVRYFSKTTCWLNLKFGTSHTKVGLKVMCNLPVSYQCHITCKSNERHGQLPEPHIPEHLFCVNEAKWPFEPNFYLTNFDLTGVPHSCTITMKFFAGEYCQTIPPNAPSQYAPNPWPFFPFACMHLCSNVLLPLSNPFPAPHQQAGLEPTLH
jgi:hypothetical protein